MTQIRPTGPTTTNAGVPVASDEHSMTQGPGGGIVDADLGKRVESAVRDQQALAEPTTGAGAVPGGDPAAGS